MRNPSPTGWHRPVLLACGILLAGLLTGCMDTQTTVQLHVVPRINQPLNMPVKASIEVAAMQDVRPVYIDRLAVIYKRQCYGPCPLWSPGAYVTKRPVADIFGEALNAALQQNGFNNTNATGYVLQGEIADFTCEAIANRVLTTKIASKLSVQFELMDKASGLKVWDKRYEGQAVGKTDSADGGFFAGLFSRSAENVISQLISDKTFRSYFEP